MSNSCPTCQGLLLQIPMNDSDANEASKSNVKRTKSVTELYKRLAMCDICSEKLYNDNNEAFVRPNRLKTSFNANFKVSSKVPAVNSLGFERIQSLTAVLSS